MIGWKMSISVCYLSSIIQFGVSLGALATDCDSSRTSAMLQACFLFVGRGKMYISNPFSGAHSYLHFCDEY